MLCPHWECLFPKLLLLSWAIKFLHCVFMGSQRHELEGVSGGHLAQPLSPSLGLLPTLVEVNSDFFSSALKNLPATPQPLWADDICVTFHVIFFSQHICNLPCCSKCLGRYWAVCALILTLVIFTCYFFVKWMLSTR